MNEDLLVIDDFTPPALHKALLMVVSFSKKGFVTMGKILHELKEEEKWKRAVGSIESWQDYLKQPEIGLSTNEANRLIQIYYTFIIKLGYDEEVIAEIPLKNIHYLLPLAKNVDNPGEIDALVQDALVLSQKDFKARLWDLKAEEMGLATTRTIEYMVMAKTLETNTLDRVYDIDSDLIKQTFNLP